MGEHQIQSAGFGEEQHFLALPVIFPNIGFYCDYQIIHITHQNNKRQSQNPVVSTNLTVLQWEDLTFP